MYTTAMTTGGSRLLAFAALLLWAVTAHAFPVGSASVGAPLTPPKKALMGENRPGSNCSGEQCDANVKFYYLRARWMDPSVGRFVSVDPWAGDPQAPHTLHKYMYANACPITFADPSGEIPLHVFLKYARALLPDHLLTVLAFGRWAHQAIEADIILRHLPFAKAEQPVKNGVVDILDVPWQEIYEIKPVGWGWLGLLQLARYLHDNPQLSAGVAVLGGALVDQPVPGITLMYSSSDVGLIEYEATINAKGYSGIVFVATISYAIRQTVHLLTTLGSRGSLLPF